MVFSSTLFLFGFLPLVIALYFAMPWLSWRNAVLLNSSLLFYAWGEPYAVLVMLASIGINWLFAIQAEERRDRPRQERIVLTLAIVANLGLLGWFKYANFFAASLLAVSQGVGGPSWTWTEIPLPIGISFFTFQAMSYVIDVSRGETRARRNPLDVGLYIALFPQLIAGPIVRFVDVAAEIDQRRTTVSDFAEGTRRFIIGLGKKVLLANSLAVPVDAIYDLRADELTMPLAWLGAICYALQIYYDFSGYSDMAIGLGRIFGFRFLENFHYPFISQSLTEFWRRWHISLSTWFRDYLYIPLGGNRKGPIRTYLNLAMVFALCGLWHGASWVYVVWGFYNGVVLMIERAGLAGLLERAPRPVRHLYAMVVILAGIALFRSESLTQAGTFLSQMTGWQAIASLGTAPMVAEAVRFADFVPTAVLLALAAGAIGSTPLPKIAFGRIQGAWSASSFGALGVESVRLAALAAIFAGCATLLASGSYNPFIYFRF